MSRSPAEAEPQPAVETDPVGEDGPPADYALGWTAINKLMRRGFSWSGNERNRAFLNLGTGRFAHVSGSSGFDFPDDGRALATVDWDGDGDVDVFVTNRNTPRVRYLENRSRGGASLMLLPRGVACNTGAVGARVEVRLAEPGGGRGGRRLVRAVRAGEGYLAQSSAWLHFGLGGGDSPGAPTASAMVESVVVHWPGGEAESFEGIEGTGAFVLEQGSGRATRPALTPWPERRAGPTDPRLAEAGEAAPGEAARVEAAPGEAAPGRRIVLATPVPMPRLALRPTGPGDEVTLFGVQPGGAGTGTGKAVLLHLWGSWCAPCLAELERHAPRVAELDAAGIAFVALSADDDPDEAREALASVGWRHAWAFAPAETIDLLDALVGALLDTESRLPVPASFLVDAEGRLRALYLGPVEPERLQDDRALLSATPEAQLALATPFHGRWHAPPGFDAGFFERHFARRGLEGAAAEFARASWRVERRSRVEMLREFGRESALAGDRAGAIATLRRALDEEPEHFGVLFDLGQLLHAAGELHEAISAYRRAASVDPEHGEVRFNLALAYAGTGQWRSARGELAELERLGSPLARELAGVLERLEAPAGER